MPRLLLINPSTGSSFWGMEHAMVLQSHRYSNAPLALMTVAALTPRDWEIELVDENVSPVDLDASCDVVGITAMNVQAYRAFELADAFRSRGRTVVLGGPFPTLEPDRSARHADVVVIGEAERTWPKVCSDFVEGRLERRYVETERIDLARSPVPRYDLLQRDVYSSLPIQTSRGCPYNCEFCDIIVMQGRRVRTKPVENVLAELEAIRKVGGHSVFFTDDNFVGNVKYARSLLRALIAYRRDTAYEPLFFTQASINLADHSDLLSLLTDAGFTRVFLGIESPRQASIREAGKRQNLHGSLIERIHKIQRAGLMTWAGMIVGFDHDDPEIFEEQAAFLQEAGIAVAMVGMLNAPPKTPLYERLRVEGRLHPQADWADNCAWTNIVPKRMSRAELFRGYRDLVRELYSQENYAQRVLSNLERMRGGSPKSRRPPAVRDLYDLWRAIKLFTFSKDPARRRHFVPNMLRIAKRYPSRAVEGAIHLGIWLHFERYVPELVRQLDEAIARERVVTPAQGERGASGVGSAAALSTIGDKELELLSTNITS